MFSSLRPMASTESLNFSMNSKRKSFPMWLHAGTRLSFPHSALAHTLGPTPRRTQHFHSIHFSHCRALF
jgi:hypothetical protein